MWSLIAPLFVYTHKSCFYSRDTNTFICVAFLFLMYLYWITSLVYLVLKNPNVPHLGTGSLNLTPTVSKKLYIIASEGSSHLTHYGTTFCLPYLWQTCTFSILFPTYLFTSSLFPFGAYRTDKILHPLFPKFFFFNERAGPYPKAQLYWAGRTTRPQESQASYDRRM